MLTHVQAASMILSFVIKSMINHYIFAKQGYCYHGDMKLSMLLCISTEKFAIVVQLWVASKAAEGLHSFKRESTLLAFFHASCELCTLAQCGACSALKHIIEQFSRNGGFDVFLHFLWH